jgi:hypothetical protein
VRNIPHGLFHAPAAPIRLVYRAALAIYRDLQYFGGELKLDLMTDEKISKKSGKKFAG